MYTRTDKTEETECEPNGRTLSGATHAILLPTPKKRPGPRVKHIVRSHLDVKHVVRSNRDVKHVIRSHLDVKHVVTSSSRPSQPTFSPDRPPPPQPYAPPAYPPLYPPYDAAPPAMRYETDDYPSGYPAISPPSMLYPQPPVAGVDYYGSTLAPEPRPVYLPHATSYPVVSALPPLVQYSHSPAMQHPLSQHPNPSHQPPVSHASLLQLPIYSLQPIHQPQYPPELPPQYLAALQSQSHYPPEHLMSAAPPPQPQYLAPVQAHSHYPPERLTSAASQLQSAAGHQLLQYTAPSMPSYSDFPGLFELTPSGQPGGAQYDEYEDAPSDIPSLADTTRKLDDILGKRPQDRTEEEIKFRDEHLAARGRRHETDAMHRERRRQMAKGKLSDCREQESKWG
jgi:hypothetical protein